MHIQPRAADRCGFVQPTVISKYIRPVVGISIDTKSMIGVD